MNDETKALVKSIRSGIETSGWACDALDPRQVLALLAHVDGEQARSDARAEEVREACARQFPKGPEESFFDPWAAEVVRATPLTSTPLADRIAELEASVRVSESLLRVTTAERDEAEARVAELEAERDAAQKELLALKKAVTDKLHFDMRALLDGTPERRLEAERDALRAQVEAARRWAVHDSHGRGLVDVMDEAKPRQG